MSLALYSSRVRSSEVLGIEPSYWSSIGAYTVTTEVTILQLFPATARVRRVLTHTRSCRAGLAIKRVLLNPTHSFALATVCAYLSSVRKPLDAGRKSKHANAAYLAAILLALRYVNLLQRVCPGTIKAARAANQREQHRYSDNACYTHSIPNG
jgi:hypothetical protein